MVAADIQDGAVIRVTNGAYRNLEGATIAVTKDDAIVRIRLRSLDLIMTIPTVFLEALQNPEGDAKKPVPEVLRDVEPKNDYDREVDALADLILAFKG
jgi:hypothetical protein